MKPICERCNRMLVEVSVLDIKGWFCPTCKTFHMEGHVGSVYVNQDADRRDPRNLRPKIGGNKNGKKDA